MRIPVPLVIDMTDQQAADYAAEFGLGDGGKVMAKDMVNDVRRYVLTALQGSTLGQFADVSIKGR